MQVMVVLAGALALEAGIWGLTRQSVPSERQFFELREEGDYTLTVEGLDADGKVIADYGEMSYDKREDLFKFKLKPVTPRPVSVRVTSNRGGTATKVVKVR